MSYSVAIVGPKEEILGFSALGVEVHNADASQEALEILIKIKRKNSNSDQKTAIVFVIEDLIAGISPQDYQKLTAQALPAIIPLPGCKGSSGFGNEKIRRIVEKAVGSDIFGN